MKYSNNHSINEVRFILKPENVLEEKLLLDETFIKGLWWGTPRYGHPEGLVILHIRELLDNIDKLTLSPEKRKLLRLVAYVHDTFKYIEHEYRQKGIRDKTHGILAKKFIVKYTDEKIVLDLLEWHDEVYFCWRMIHIFHEEEEGLKRLERFLQLFENSIQDYYLFFKCDTKTGDKNLAPIKWFESHVKGIEIVNF